MKRWNMHTIISIVVSLVVLIIVTRPLFHPGLFPTIDNISVVRLEAMAHELANRQFPVRYVSELGRGHGYALFGYYAPLPFYTGAALHLTGTNLVGALKRSYLLAIVLGSVGIFGLSYELFGVAAAGVSVIAYALSPFLGYDVYWRGGIGEVWAMGFVSWALWFLFRAVRDSSRRDAMFAAVFIAGLMMSHNLTAYMGILFLGIWSLSWIYTYKKGLFEAAGAGIVGLGLSAFFWFPAFMTRTMIWVSYLQADRSKLFEGLLHGSIREIFVPTFIPMIINWTAIIIPIAAWLVLWKKGSSTTIRFGAGIVGILFATALFFMTPFSRSVWDMFFPVLYIFQFPWRFLTMMTIFGSVLTGGLVYVMPNRRWVMVVLMLGVFVYANLANFRPLSYEFVDKYRPQDPCGTSWGFEYLPVWVKTCLKTPWDAPYRVMSGDALVTVTMNVPRMISFTIEARRQTVMEIGQYAYSGWRVLIDGKETVISRDNEFGLIEVVVPEGTHTVQAIQRNTPVEQWSNVISGGSATIVVGASIYGIFARRKRRVLKKLV